MKLSSAAFAFAIATMPDLIATGRSGHRSMMVAKSGSIAGPSDAVFVLSRTPFREIQ